MPTFSQQELYELISEYMESEDRIVAQAKQCSQVKYADDEMFGFFPLWNQLSFRGTHSWSPPEGKWLKKKPGGPHYIHGFNEHGDVEYIEWSNGIVSVFRRFDGLLERITYGGRANNLKRYIVEDDVITTCYDYNLDPHQYSREDFEYLEGRCVKSTIHSWYFSRKSDTWESGVLESCTYEYDARGLKRGIRDMGERLGGEEIMYARK